MTTTTAQIANHLNIVESLIAEVQEWANVLFVRFTSGRPRFVSKKVVKKMETMNLPGLEGSDKQVAWASDLRAAYLSMVEESTKWLTGKIESNKAKGRNTEEKENDLAELPKLSKLILESDNASWWIHHRSSIFVGEPRTVHSRAYQMYCHAVRNAKED